MASIVELGIQYAYLVVPVFFLGFLAVTSVAVLLGGRPRVRRAYLGLLLAGLVVTNLFVPFVPLPMTHWNKFSEPRPAEWTLYELRVVDDTGEELRFDEMAILRSDGGMSPRFVNNWFHPDSELSPAEKREAAQYVLGVADEHRDRLLDRPLAHLLRFPSHSGTATVWQPATVRGYGEFVAVRLYRIDVLTTETGNELESYTEGVVYEYHADGSGTGTNDTRVLSAPAEPPAVTAVREVAP